MGRSQADHGFGACRWSSKCQPDVTFGKVDITFSGAASTPTSSRFLQTAAADPTAER